MKNLWLLIVILFAVSVSGCANDMMEIPVSALTSDESRMKAYSVIGDASTAKEAIIHKTWQTFYQEMDEANEGVGFHIDFEPVAGVPGAIRLTSVSWQPPITMPAPPKEPSQHPVWKTVDNVVNRGIMWAGIGWIAHEWRGMQESAYDAAGNTYNGPTNMKGSYNTAGRDNYITMAGTQNTNTGTEARQGVNSPSNEEDDSAICKSADDWTSLDGCSCGSCWEGKCGDPSICPKS